ncbi:hypothetical protein TNCV_5017031 [Trichonephila clavipes]|nr:hypothetical protein TNCV_5017031 [Trichonephila clavipes]
MKANEPAALASSLEDYVSEALLLVLCKEISKANIPVKISKSPECLFGLGALGKIKFLVPLRLVKAQAHSSVEETDSQNPFAVIDVPPIWWHTKKVIPDLGECAKSVMVNTNP